MIVAIDTNIITVWKSLSAWKSSFLTIRCATEPVIQWQPVPMNKITLPPVALDLSFVIPMSRCWKWSNFTRSTELQLTNLDGKASIGFNLFRCPFSWLHSTVITCPRRHFRGLSNATRHVNTHPSTCVTGVSIWMMSIRWVPLSWIEWWLVLEVIDSMRNRKRIMNANKVLLFTAILVSWRRHLIFHQSDGFIRERVTILFRWVSWVVSLHRYQSFDISNNIADWRNTLTSFRPRLGAFHFKCDQLL